MRCCCRLIPSIRPSSDSKSVSTLSRPWQASGVICENMAASGVYLALGNEMLLSLDPQYPTQQRFKVRQHTVEAVASIMSALEPPTPDWATNIPAGGGAALDVFVGD